MVTTWSMVLLTIWPIASLASPIVRLVRQVTSVNASLALLAISSTTENVSLVPVVASLAMLTPYRLAPPVPPTAFSIRMEPVSLSVRRLVVALAVLPARRAVTEASLVLFVPLGLP